MTLAQQRKVIFNDFQYDVLAELFHEETGIHLTKSRESLIESRLRKRLFELQTDGNQYIKLVKENKDERKRFVDFLTTHKTEWNREMVHFHFLTRWLHQEGEKIVHQRPLMFWSAASSTGEEAYSLAMHLLRHHYNPDQFRILGTDISSSCVNQAQRGAFKFDSLIEDLPIEVIKQCFGKALSEKGERMVQVRPDVHPSIKFRVHNLYTDTLPERVEFDVIFLRNVLIYFTPEKCAKIIDRVCRHLRVGGHLILGLSESLPHGEEYKRQFRYLKPEGSSIFKKVRS